MCNIYYGFIYFAILCMYFHMFLKERKKLAQEMCQNKSKLNKEIDKWIDNK